MIVYQLFLLSDALSKIKKFPSISTDRISIFGKYLNYSVISDINLGKCNIEYSLGCKKTHMFKLIIRVFRGFHLWVLDLS